MTTETPPLEENLLNLSDELLTTDVEVKPAHRAARVLITLMQRYEADPIGCFGDALADMMHAADALGLDFMDAYLTANRHYLAELRANGPAPCLVPQEPLPEPTTRSFTVIVTRDVTESVVLQVEATSQDLAETLALQRVQTEIHQWTVDDNIPPDPYVTDTSLSDPQERSDAARLEAQYRDSAIRLRHRDGEIEIDDRAKVSISEDDGAYVQAWVWVSNSDAGIPDENEDEDKSA